MCMNKFALAKSFLRRLPRDPRSTTRLFPVVIMCLPQGETPRQCLSQNNFRME